MSSTRRQVLTGISLSTTAAVLAAEGRSMPMMQAQAAGELAPAFRGKHELTPLPFDPKKLRGISEKLMLSHHENNYGGAVRNLNKVEAALGATTKDTAAFVLAGLKDRELSFSNSKSLHELYFGNLGGDGKPAGEIAKALGESYGTLARWEEEFRATGVALGGGSGWVILDFDLATKALRTHASGNHTQTGAAAVPLLVMDMYEHAYQMDHGAAAAKYIDAFFDNLQWEAVERRFARAAKAWQALQG